MDCCTRSRFLKDGMESLKDHTDLVSKTQRISAAAIDELEGEITIIDIRNENEWEGGHIENSINIPLNHLADRIAGGGPLKTPFGTDKNGLTLNDRKELQERLTKAGFDTGGADGVIGPKSIGAISGYERSQGLPVTGTPSQALLQRLR